MGTPALHPLAQAVAATAGPGEPVPVAFLGRTSTATLQDPVASLGRQLRNCRAWLPAGWQIVACYWDVESGGIDLEQRGQGRAWEPAAAAGIPRDGGITDLLTEARSPTPSFAVVICEDIERSARDTFNSLKLERELNDQGIPLFATDEPAHIDGINPTTVLVRRVKQGVAEWYRLQLKEKVWNGLKEHSLAGWNLGTVPYGYTAERHPHPNPAKNADGRTKTRLAIDPVRGPVVTRIFQWRAEAGLGLPTIAARLNADPARYPAPSPDSGWTAPGLHHLLANPKYTGYMVLGRRRRERPMPPSEWIWSPEPTHPALVDKATWDAAQRAGAEHGNVRDTELPSTRPGRHYLLRSRLWCKICRRRMRGAARTGPAYRAPYIYYRCPHDRSIPRHAAAHPEHPTVIVREDDLMTALTTFFADHVFGPDRAAMLATALPESATEQASQRTAKSRRAPPPAHQDRHRRDSADQRTGSTRRPRRPRRPGPPAADPRPVHRPVHRTHPHRSRASRSGDRHHPGQRPRPPGQTARPRGHPDRRPRPAHRAALRRLPRHRRLQQRPPPGHHQRHPHRRHPPGHR